MKLGDCFLEVRAHIYLNSLIYEKVGIKKVWYESDWVPPFGGMSQTFA